MTTTRIGPLLSLALAAVLVQAGPAPRGRLPGSRRGSRPGRLRRADQPGPGDPRAADWLRRDVAYSQDNSRAQWDLNRTRYRPDCSGFVSMAWALDPGRPGLGRAPVTWELPAYATRIRWASLHAGDILLRLEPPTAPGSTS